MIIAFMGVDGSGKTTLARLVERKLRKMGFGVIYYPGFKHLLVGSFLKILPRNKAKKTQEKFLERSRKKKPFFFKIWPYFVYVDCLILYMKFRFFTRNKIVIFDRYFYDFLISYENLGYSSKTIRYLFLHLPKPDVGFVLDAPANITYKRKKSDYSVGIDYYSLQRERYLDLARRLEFKLLKTTKQLEKTTEEVFTELRKDLLRKDQ